MDSRPERKCAWCGADISHRHPNAKFCDEGCMLRNRYGGPIPGDTIECLNCKKPFVKQKNERHCSKGCREAHRQLRKYGQGKSFNGPPAPRPCAYCGSSFSSFDKKQIYCRRGGTCAQRAYRESDTGLAYFAREDVRERQREASRRHYYTDHGIAAQRERDAHPKNVKRRAEYSRSERGKQKKRECQRRRAAAKAVSLLILPME